MSAGFSAQHVPFRGAANGRIDFAVSRRPVRSDSFATSDLSRSRSASSARSASLPNVPTVLEAGLTAQTAYPFYTGVYLPAKTRRAIVVKLHDEVMKAFALPAVKERWRLSGSSRCP